MDIKYHCIFAMNENRIIGKNNALPWNIREDLHRFRSISYNSILVMGRKTLNSLPNGMQLKGRINVVLTRNPDKYIGNDELIYVNAEQVYDVVESLVCKYITKKVYVIGGEDIFRLFLPKIHVIYMTMVYITLPHELDSNYALFPLSHEEIREKYNEMSSSIIHESIDSNFTYQFFTYVRR